MLLTIFMAINKVGFDVTIHFFTRMKTIWWFTIWNISTPKTVKNFTRQLHVQETVVSHWWENETWKFDVMRKWADIASNYHHEKVNITKLKKKKLFNLAICIGNHMISSGIWNKHKKIFQRADKIAQTHRASAISVSYTHLTLPTKLEV